jgi:hemolysin III
MNRSSWRKRYILFKQETGWQTDRLSRWIRRDGSRYREPTSGFTHLAGAVLSLMAVVGLIILTWGDVPKMLTIFVFGATTTMLYCASAALHLAIASPKTLNRLARFDRVGIFVSIAGVYTPLCYFYLDGVWRWTILTVVWAIALGGSLYVIRYFQRGVSDILPMTLTYVALGAIGVLVVPKFLLPTGALLLLLIGGATYLIGTVVYSLDRPNLHERFNAHDLWHIFVLVGSGFVFAMILIYIVPL